jgi:uncharacterized protein (TIGR03435 family)
MSNRILCHIALLPALASSFLMAQDAARPSFEVASVKPSSATSGLPGVRFPPGGRMIATNMNLKSLITVAWSVDWLQISGGPAWLESDPYDIDAKADGDPPRSEKRIMLRSLLEDRFHLTMHQETKEAPGYALVMANPGHPGPGITPAREDSCIKIDPQKPLPQTTDVVFCGGFRVVPKSKEGQNYPSLVLEGHSVSLESVARALVTVVQRTVVDETHLPGIFDVTLEYVDPRIQSPDAPSAFAAVREQLGLKLESRKLPLELYIVDHVERPGAN